MSGGTKQQFKQFSITCAEDACLVLGMLISGISVNLEKYKEYASEAESLLESIQEEFVPAKEYDDVNDKLLYRQREILKFTADHQSSSFSYIADSIISARPPVLTFMPVDGEMPTLPLCWRYSPISFKVAGCSSSVFSHKYFKVRSRRFWLFIFSPPFLYKKAATG